MNSPLRERVLGLLRHQTNLDPDQRMRLAEDIVRAVDIARRQEYEASLDWTLTGSQGSG